MFSRNNSEHNSGNWIWLSARERKDNRRVFSRQHFFLEDTIHSGTLQISALPFYHVYLNGEHVGYGPASPVHSQCFADRYDISQYLVQGSNVIAVAVMDQMQPNWNAHPYPPKFWCQLLIDGHLTVTTGGDWKITEADCYFPNQPRIHDGLEQVEKVNLNTNLTGWTEIDYNDSAWERAEVINSFEDSFPPVAETGIAPNDWDESNAYEIMHSGTFQDNFSSTYYSYDGISNFQPGNYAAESFVFSSDDVSIPIMISSDDPFAVFCNDNPIASRSSNRRLMRMEKDLVANGKDDILQSAMIQLKKGWNRFLCFQDTDSSSMGLMLLFPETVKGVLSFHREPTASAMNGWLIDGPLRTPFAWSSASFQMNNPSEAVGFLPMEERINDISSYLHACTYIPDKEVVSESLHQGNYVIYDLGEFCYGFPLLDLYGNAGDIVDITCGLHLEGNAVRTSGPLGRMTDTLILGSGNNTWMRLIPKGARYVMISVRKAQDVISPIFRFVSPVSEFGSETAFVSSDETFNRIWEQAAASITHCTEQNIVDDPCGRGCQSLPEAMIYSRMLNYMNNGGPHIKRALTMFADEQLENGMLLRIVPSGVYSYAPDCCLLWILWLEDYWTHTADMDFLRQMEPCLSRLLRFFKKIPQSGSRLLPVQAGHCFLFDEKRQEGPDIFTPLNALYYRALISACRLYKFAGKEDCSAECLQISEQLRDEIIQHAQDPATFLFADSCGKHPDTTCSFCTNIMVLNSGLLRSRTQTAKILDYCCQDQTEMLRSIHTVFFHFILDTLFSNGRSDTAIALIRKAAEEKVDRAVLYERGLNPHLFPVIAADFLIREIAGIRPSVPGQAQIYFNPACDKISAAKCKIAAGKRKFDVEWKKENGDLSVRIESTAALDILPVIPRKVGATFDLGNYVNLLDPSSAGN